MDMIDCLQHDSCIHWRSTNCDGESVGFKSCQHPVEAYHAEHLIVAAEMGNRCLCGNNGGADCDWCLIYQTACDECEGFKPT